MRELLQHRTQRRDHNIERQRRWAVIHHRYAALNDLTNTQRPQVHHTVFWISYFNTHLCAKSVDLYFMFGESIDLKDKVLLVFYSFSRIECDVDIPSVTR